MRSSIPTEVFVGNGITVKSSQSLLNEVKYSNILKREKDEPISTRSQSLLNEVKYSNSFPPGTEMFHFPSQSLLNEVKYSNELLGLLLLIAIALSQSLLNEVKYSNGKMKKEEIKKEFESQSLLNEVKYSNGGDPSRNI